MEKVNVSRLKNVFFCGGVYVAGQLKPEACSYPPFGSLTAGIRLPGLTQYSGANPRSFGAWSKKIAPAGRGYGLYPTLAWKGPTGVKTRIPTPGVHRRPLRKRFDGDGVALPS